MPDNLHWGDDDALWVAGAVGTPGCRNDYAIVRLDPVSGEVRRVPQLGTLPEFGEATSALRVEEEIWVGANPGDRVLYFGAGDQ